MSTALALGGGGAKIAYHAGALAWLQEHNRLDDLAAGAGVSAGALAISMAAQGPEGVEKLSALSRAIRAERIYRDDGHWALAWRMFRKRGGLYDHGPLRDLIRTHIHGELIPARIRRRIRVGLCVWETGEYLTVGSHESDFQQAVWGSCTIAPLWEPVPWRDGQHAIDGGYRTQVPLHDVLPEPVDRIICIALNPPGVEPSPSPRAVPANLLRIISIFGSQVGADDLHHHDSRVTVIQPTEPLGDTLDFKAKTQAERWQRGYDDARVTMMRRAA